MIRCTSASEGVDVPGLTLLERFVTEQEEDELLRHFVETDAQWTGPLRRRVQHYGYVVVCRKIVSKNATSMECYTVVHYVLYSWRGCVKLAFLIIRKVNNEFVLKPL